MTCPRERRSRTRGGRRARETRVRARRVARWTRRRADAFPRTRSVARRERRGSPWRWCRGATLCASASRARPLDSIGRSAVSSLSTMPIRSARSSDETRLIGTAVGEDLRLSRDRPAPSRARRKARALPRSLPFAGRSPPPYRCSPPPHRCSPPLVAPLPLLLPVLARHPTVLAADVARRSLSAAASSSALDIGSLLALLLLSHGAAAVCRVITSPVMAR